MNAHRTCCKSGSRHMLSLLGDKAQSDHLYPEALQGAATGTLNISIIKYICTET